MIILSKATKKKKPTKPKVSRGKRKPAKPLNEDEKKVSTHLKETFLTLRAAVATDVVQQALDSAHINTSTDKFPWEIFDTGLVEVATPLAEITRRAIIQPHLMPKTIAVQTRFNHLDPRVIASARNQASKLAASMTAEQYAKVRTIIGDGVASGNTAREIGRTLRNHIGLSARQDKQMANAIEKATAQAVKEGIFAPEMIDARVAEVTDSLYTKLINYRAELIARTETMKAQNAGFMIGVQQSVEDPNTTVDTTWLKRWIATDDERTCVTCGALDGTEVPVDEDFETDEGDSIPYPLADGATPHPQCRCTVGLVPPDTNISQLVSQVQSQPEGDFSGADMVDITASLDQSDSFVDQVITNFLKYDPDQPRDEKGRWTSGAGGDSGARNAGIEANLNRWQGKLNNSPDWNGRVLDVKEIFRNNDTADEKWNEIHYSIMKDYMDKGMGKNNADWQAQADLMQARFYLENADSPDKFDKAVAYSKEWEQSPEGQKYYAENPDKPLDSIRMVERAQYAEQQSKDIIANGNVTIATTADNLQQILSDGRFKNQFETKTSGGLMNNTTRKIGEGASLNIPTTAVASGRPVYGYLTTNETPSLPYTESMNDVSKAWNEISSVNNRGVNQYGDIRVVLNDSVRGNTTATIGDSLRTGNIAEHVNAENPDLINAGLYKFGAVEHIAGMPTASYVEAQIHGGVSAKDIATIYAPAEQVNSVSNMLKTAGLDIPVKVRG